MINVCVCYATPQQQAEVMLEVEASITVIMAIRRSGVLEQFPEINIAQMQVGVFAKKVPLDALLHDGDRIEIYRPLQCDPKQARLRRKARSQ